MILAIILSLGVLLLWQFIDNYRINDDFIDFYYKGYCPYGIDEFGKIKLK